MFCLEDCRSSSLLRAASNLCWASTYAGSPSAGAPPPPRAGLPRALDLVLEPLQLGFELGDARLGLLGGRPRPEDAREELAGLPRLLDLGELLLLLLQLLHAGVALLPQRSEPGRRPLLRFVDRRARGRLLLSEPSLSLSRCPSRRTRGPGRPGPAGSARGTRPPRLRPRPSPESRPSSELRLLIQSSRSYPPGSDERTWWPSLSSARIVLFLTSSGSGRSVSWKCALL